MDKEMILKGNKRMELREQVEGIVASMGSYANNKNKSLFLEAKEKYLLCKSHMRNVGMHEDDIKSYNQRIKNMEELWETINETKI